MNKTYQYFPEIEPYHTGQLSVSDLHSIYFEECGNPNGYPVVVLHGGPGGGATPTQRRFFDPNFYRIILFDQRGCARSTPLGETRENTLDDLIADMEKLRQHLNITKWLVFGGSWGSTLGIIYALVHYSRVSGLVLRGIFLSRRFELDWFLGGVKVFFPENWQALCEDLSISEQKDIFHVYQKRIFSNDKSLAIASAIRWNAFESSMLTLLPRENNHTSEINADLELARAKVQIHYIAHQCFLQKRDLFHEVKNSIHVPTTIVQGRYDMVCPPITAWELAQNMPYADFYMVQDAGHSASEIGITSRLIEAVENFKDSALAL